MPIIKANNINIHYKQLGAGPDLVLIAGFTANHNSWFKLLPILSEHFRITTFDNRGVGKTDAPAAAYSIEQMADDTAALMNALDINSAYVLGHSLGGLIVQALCVNHATKIKKAIFLCSRLINSPVFALHNQINSELLKLNVSHELVAKNAATFFLGSEFVKDEAKLDEYIKMAVLGANLQKETGRNGQIAAGANFDRIMNLAKITQPVLAIYADEDLIASLKNVDILKKNISNLTTIILNCGHTPQLEQPQILAEHLQTFLL